MRNLAASAAILLAALSATPAPAAAQTGAGTHAESYRLHAQDRLLVRVVTWNFDQNGIAEWGGISGEYLIAPDGTLQFPMAGTITAQGQTLTQLQASLAASLRRNAGLDRAPQLSIELVSSLPVYVLGVAQTRGAVEFRPGLTARQALALAGGVYRTSAAADPMQIARIVGDARLATEEMRRQQAERAVIEAELAELERPEPPAVTLPPADADLQTRMQAADRMARQAQMASLDSLRDLLTEKSEMMRRQIVLRDQQIADHRRDLESMSELKEKGLAVNARVTALTSSINDIESKRLDIEATLLLAEQQLNEAERARTAITDDARSANLQRLAQLEAEMAATAIQLDTTGKLLTQATLAGEIAGDDTTPEEPDFIVTRTRNGQTERLTIGPDVALAPGDVLEVTLPATPAPIPLAAAPAAPDQLAASQALAEQVMAATTAASSAATAR